MCAVGGFDKVIQAAAAQLDLYGRTVAAAASACAAGNASDGRLGFADLNDGFRVFTAQLFAYLVRDLPDRSAAILAICKTHADTAVVAGGRADIRKVVSDFRDGIQVGFDNG